MISSYRLGDLILLHIEDTAKAELVAEYPNSLGAKFIAEKEKDQSISNVDIFFSLVTEYLAQIELPPDITTSTVIHVRLGDVVAGTSWHELLKRPLDVEDIQTVLRGDGNKKYVIGKCFFAKASSCNYEECIEASNKYLQSIITKVPAEWVNSGNADIDFCCAVMADKFVQGKGYFSKLIVEIRKKMGKASIETDPI